MRTCSKCHKQFPDDFEFCPYCGQNTFNERTKVLEDEEIIDEPDETKSILEVSEELLALMPEGFPVEKLLELEARAKANGNILSDIEVNIIFLSSVNSAEAIDFMMEYLQYKGINIIYSQEEDEDDTLSPEDEEKVKRETEDITEAEIASAMTVPEGISVDDPVRKYLKEFGNISILSDEDEVELVKRIDKNKQLKLVEFFHSKKVTPFKIKTNQELKEAFKMLNVLLTAEQFITDKRSVAVAFRKFVTKRKNGEAYDVDDFVADTVQFTNSERRHFIELLEKEKLNCADWDKKHSKRTEDNMPEPQKLSIISAFIIAAEFCIAERIQYNSHKSTTKKVEKRNVQQLNEIKTKFEKLLKEIKRQGEDAKQCLLQANLRLVVGVAKRYVGCGMSFLDLIQEGNLGLMKAVDELNYDEGFKFRNYAVQWIRLTITSAMRRTRRW